MNTPTPQLSVHIPNLFRKYALAGLVSFIVLAVGMGGYLMGIKRNPNARQSSQDTIQPTPQTDWDNMKMRVYPSLDNQFFFYMYPVVGSNVECHFGITDKFDYYEREVRRLLNRDTINCVDDINGFSGAFQRWANNNKFLIMEKEGELKIVDWENSKVETFGYDSTLLSYEGSSKSLKYWLFRKNPNKNAGASYILMDSSKNVVNDNLDFKPQKNGVYGLFTTLYDVVNDGFLFAMRNFTEDTENMVSYKYDFLSLTDLSYRTLLITTFIDAGSFRGGCSGYRLESKPGEIILISDCIIAAEQYRQSDSDEIIPPFNRIPIKL